MTINLHLPDSVLLKPCITVFGVGGAGCNAVNNMINANLEGAKFVVANTDSQALHLSNADHKIQLGASITKGLGAGASPDVGKAAAEEAIEEIEQILSDSNMVFITAGMGGGTGTGAAPVIAKLAKERGILTVGVVTKPFHFEGLHRMRLAENGLAELQKFVDTLIVIPNQNLFKIANAKTTFADAFKMADDVLHAGVRGITDLMIMPGLINLDFADIRAVMSEMGKAMMGTGEAQGENRAIVAAEAAISNPLLDNCSMKGAKGVLINISGGYDMTLFEVDEAANRIREEVDSEANIIFGSAFNADLDGIIRVSVVATGIEDPMFNSLPNPSSSTRVSPPVVNPSTIQQIQQLYKAEQRATPASIFQHSQQSQLIVEKENTTKIQDEVFFAPKPIDPEQDNQNHQDEISNHEEPKEAPMIQEKLNEEKKPSLFSSSLAAPQKASPALKKTVVSKPFSLFDKVSAIMRPSRSEEKEDEQIYDLVSQDLKFKEENDIVSEEMLNVPAYQRRK